MKFKRIKKSGGLAVELGAAEKQIPDQPPVMFRLKKILVPVDFSDCSRKAVQYGLALAKQFGAELTILHVIQSYLQVPDLAVVDVTTFQRELQASAEKQLEALEKTLGSQIVSHTLVSSGEPSAEITSTAREIDADIIVIATHGRTGLKHVFMGSVAERVVRHAGCPVLVVRELEHEFVRSEQVGEMVHPS
jgi:nucleotide-binding universal stress UspA family protein